ncbi:imidazole glycerol phosphate synthase subunit HisH [Litorivicinus sp.]|nr:imidazole glycerol phosphate synthase subunit HisH [Litorivicinus sp.]
MMNKIGIIDLPGSNPRGIQGALAQLGKNTQISRKIEQLKKCDSLIIPGVGSFGPAAKFLSESGLDDFLKERHSEAFPLLGICLGFQLLSKSSEEAPLYKGLGLIPAKSIKIQVADHQKLPNVGWRVLTFSGRAFRDSVIRGSAAYFAHSYEVRGNFHETDIVKASYGDYELLAAVKVGNLWGAQFHPEKSHDTGLRFLEAFLSGDAGEG